MMAARTLLEELNSHSIVYFAIIPAGLIRRGARNKALSET